MKQDEVSSADRDISLFPTPGATACDNTCSSGTPNGRFIVLGQDLTLIAPVHRPRADARRLPALRRRAGPLQLRAVQLHPGAARALWRLRQSHPGAGRQRQFLGARASTTGAIRRTRRRRCRCSSAPTPATAICSTRSRSTPPTRSTRSGRCVRAAISTARPTARSPITPSSAAASSRTGRAATTRASTLIMSPPRSTARSSSVGHDWYWDVNGLWGRNKAEQEVHGNINAANLARALGPVAACTAPCVPFNIFGGDGLDHPADARLCRLHPARQQPAAAVGLLGQPHRRPVRPARRRRPASPSASSIATSRGRFDPDPIVAAGPRLRHPGPADLGQLQRQTRPMPNCACPCCATRPSSTASS